VTRSDKKRILRALARHEARFREAQDAEPIGAGLAAAVDWLRAECKLIDACLDDDATGWSGEYMVEAATLVGQVAARAAGEIRADLK
jgi:hypothetical protein